MDISLLGPPRTEREFREQRINEFRIIQIESYFEDTPTARGDGGVDSLTGVLALHLIPDSAVWEPVFRSASTIQQHTQYFRALGEGRNFKINSLGVSGVLAESKCQWFRNGIYEDFWHGIVYNDSRFGKVIGLKDVLIYLNRTVSHYVKVSEPLGWSSSIHCRISLHELKSARIEQDRFNHHLVETDGAIELPTALIERNVELSVAEQMRPTLDGLWNVFGQSACPHIEELAKMTV